MTNKYHLSIPADLNNSHLVREYAKEIILSAKVSHIWVHRLVLVIDELFMNAVLYGSKNTSDMVDINFSVGKDKIVFEVEDRGTKKETKISASDLIDLIKNKSQKPSLDESGRGLAIIIKSWTDAFSIIQNSFGGITVKAEKKIK